MTTGEATALLVESCQEWLLSTEHGKNFTAAKAELERRLEAPSLSKQEKARLTELLSGLAVLQGGQ